MIQRDDIAEAIFLEGLDGFGYGVGVASGPKPRAVQDLRGTQGMGMGSVVDALPAQPPLTPPVPAVAHAPGSQLGFDPRDELPDLPSGGSWESPGSPEPNLPEGFLYPGAVDAAAEAWESFDPPKYRLQGGDTFIGLATTYLGNPARWREIYQLQPASARATKGTRGWIAGQDVINMPKEAADNMRKWMRANEPSAVTPAEVAKSGAGMSTGTKVALAAGAAALGWYLLK